MGLSNKWTCKSASLRAVGVVKQLLDFSRQVDQELKPIDIVIVIRDALKFLRSSIPSTIEILKQLPNSEISILGDPIQINQIMMNLCSNASQAMEENGGILKVILEKIYLSVDSENEYVKLPEGNYVKISIIDLGPGISTEIRDRIFDPYFTTKEIGKGTGMGLSVVHGIVNNHNGDISVYSNPGQGTTFNLLFPIIDGTPEVKIKTPDEWYKIG